MTANSFLKVLEAPGPASDRAAKMSLYGWLIGSWTMETIRYFDDNTRYRGPGEIHFSWVLQGRAIQDVWILSDVYYGTTLRIYDPGIDAWHIVWCDPLNQIYTRQIGRACGSDIVQDGTNAAGELIRWSFTEIAPDSFHWLGERSRDNGATWQLEAETFARRADSRDQQNRSASDV